MQTQENLPSLGEEQSMSEADVQSHEERGKASTAALVKSFFAYFAFWIMFAVVFAVMLVMLTAAVIGVPAGIMFGFFGIAVTVFKADFIITEFSGEFMLFGGFCCAFASGFVGLLAVKAGFVTGRVFVRVKRLCDRLRGW